MTGQQILPEEAEKLMGLVLDHYIKHHQVVLRKLGHARDATKESMQDIKKRYPSNDDDGPGGKAMREVEAYDQTWKKIIAMFEVSGATEEELEGIEQVLARIPALIRRYYDLLVKRDEILQELLTELDRPEYKNALAVAKKVQSGRDMLSGLMPSEFELEVRRQSYIYRAANIKDSHS